MNEKEKNIKEYNRVDSRLDSEINQILKEKQDKIKENDEKSFNKRLSFYKQNSIKN